MSRPVPWLPPAAATVALLLTTTAATVEAQEAADTAPAHLSQPPSEPDTAKRIAIAARARGPVVAARVTYPVGSAQDASGRGGSAWLLASTLEAMLRDALGPGIDVSVATERSTFSVTVVAEPQRWESTFRTVITVLQRRDLDAAAFEDERASLLARMAFEAGAPVRDFETEAARLYGAGEAEWARPPDGTPESLGALDVGDLEAFRTEHLRHERAVVSVVGPVDPGAATDVATAVPRRDRPPRLKTAVSGRSAWAAGERVPVVREITNTALAVAYPLPPHHGRTEAEFLAHVVGESLNSDPPDPGVYRVEASILDAPAGSLLVIEAAVFPEVGGRWERKITDAVRIVASANPDEDVYFPWRLRRFRSAALGAEATPEGLSNRLNADLLRQGSVRDLDAEIDSLTARGLVALANELGEPRVLLFGPDMADAQQH